MNKMRAVIKAKGAFTGKEEIKEPCFVFLAEGKIEKIVPARNQSEIAGDILDFSDLILLPGLIDCHVHLFMEGIYDMGTRTKRWKEGRELTLLRAAKNLEQTLRSGVTTIRDLGGPEKLVGVLNQGVKEGVLSGSRVIRAGQAICITGGHFYYGGNYQADGVEELRKAVRVLCKEKVQVVKIMLTGCVNFVKQDAGFVEFTRKETEAIIHEAHRLGRKVAVHVNGEAGVRLALEAGADTIEHGALLQESCIEWMKEKLFYWVPTLIPFQRMYDYGRDYHYPAFPVEKVAEIYGQHQRVVSKAREAGMKIVAGTDAGALGVAHGNLAGEMSLLKKYGGFTAQEAILAGTLWAAEALGLEKEIGSLEVGKKADIIGVRENPLQDIDRIKQVAAVWKDGQLVHQEK